MVEEGPLPQDDNDWPSILTLFHRILYKTPSHPGSPQINKAGKTQLEIDLCWHEHDHFPSTRDLKKSRSGKG